jgi:predicted Mrr-cat superfamily restriction endonuclease
MGKGDLFVFPVTGGDEIHIGEITGDYEFASTDAELVASDSAHLRRVRWFTTVSRSRFTREALKCFDSEHTVHSGSGYRKQVADVLAALPGDSVKSNGAQIEQS